MNWYDYVLPGYSLYREALRDYMLGFWSENRTEEEIRQEYEATKNEPLNWFMNRWEGLEKWPGLPTLDIPTWAIALVALGGAYLLLSRR